MTTRTIFAASGSRQGLLLTAPAVLVVSGIVAFAFASLVCYSIWTQTYLDMDHTPTTLNYQRFFREPMFLFLLGKSLLIALGASVITVLAAYPVAYYVSFKVQRRKLLWITILTLPFWMSYLLRVFSWKLILGYNGILNTGLGTLGLISAPVEALLHNSFAVVLTLTHSWAPFAVVPIFLSMERIDRSLLQAAADLGDTPLQAFRRVVWPLTLSGVFSAGILIFIPTVGDYVTPQLVGGTSGIMIGNLIFAMFTKLNNWPLGSAIALMSLLAIGLIVFAASRLLGVHKVEVK